MKPVQISTEWLDMGRYVGIGTKHEDGTTEAIRIPAEQLEDLADKLARMAYHGFIKHHTAAPGSDYGRKAKDDVDDHE